jgi:hypothetical protein
VPVVVMVVMPNRRGIAKLQGPPCRLQKLCTGAPDRHSGTVERFWSPHRSHSLSSRNVLSQLLCVGGLKGAWQLDREQLKFG